MDVSGRILRAWMPAIHAGMTEAADGQSPSNNGVGVEGCTSFFMLCGECKLMTHFVVKSAFLVLARCQRQMEFALFTTGVLPQAFPLAPIGLPAP